ncbi:MAG: hypothetical protein P1U84_17580 [Parvibaculaceae bacterium]|nr:hypothetical protein [Parvibaculaceae bacterium]
MIDLLAQSEAIPSAYPAVPSGLSSRASDLDPAVIWGRIEAYTAHRFTPRAVAWTIRGCAGEEWTPPLTPLVSHSAERWWDAQWTAVDLLPGPLGLCLPSDGTFRITGQLGGGPVPAPVSEAYCRLAEYLADTDDRAGVSSYGMRMGGEMSEEYRRDPKWIARAMDLSGAADLLRPYKRRA